MHRLRVYIDTSVFGGCFDEEFKEYSDRLFKEIIEGKKIAVMSDVTEAELRLAPALVQKILDLIPVQFIESVNLSPEAEGLALTYLKEKAVPKKCFQDAMHIALATIARVDVLVSWNFKHIVNLDRIRKYNGINMKYGYGTIEIRNPREVVGND